MCPVHKTNLKTMLIETSEEGVDIQLSGNDYQNIAKYLGDGIMAAAAKIYAQQQGQGGYSLLQIFQSIVTETLEHAEELLEANLPEEDRVLIKKDQDRSRHA